jgi:hypothetical protein
MDALLSLDFRDHETGYSTGRVDQVPRTDFRLQLGYCELGYLRVLLGWSPVRGYGTIRGPGG